MGLNFSSVNSNQIQMYQVWGYSKNSLTEANARKTWRAVLQCNHPKQLKPHSYQYIASNTPGNTNSLWKHWWLHALPMLFPPPHTGGKFMKRRAMQKRLFLPSPDFVYWLLLTNTYVCICIYAYIFIYAHRKKAFHKEIPVFCFPVLRTTMHELRCWGRAGHRAEDRQQGSWSNVIITPHAEYCGVSAPEGLSSLCWGWRGKRTGRRLWPIQELYACRCWDRADPTGLAFTNMEDPAPHHLLKATVFTVYVYSSCFKDISASAKLGQ